MNVWVTDGAAPYTELPDWLAVREQVPAATRVTSVPATVQNELLLETNVTGRFELAFALRAKGSRSQRSIAQGRECDRLCFQNCKSLDDGKTTAAQVEWPGWLAVMEQVPPAIGVTLAPRTVHMVVLFEANATARLEVAVALNAKDPVPATSVAGGLNVMVWVPSTVNVWVTDGAAPYTELPDWLAVMEQVPMATMVTSATATVQAELVLETNVTGRFELAFAVRAKAGAPRGRLFNAANVIVCAFRTVKV